MTDKIIALTTCDSEEQAKRIAHRLIEQRLAACVNIVSNVRSVYRWKEKIEDAAEFLLVIKSRRDLFAALRAEIERIHTYEIPEIIAIPIVDGSEAYLGWFDRELSK